SCDMHPKAVRLATQFANPNGPIPMLQSPMLLTAFKTIALSLIVSVPISTAAHDHGHHHAGAAGQAVITTAKSGLWSDAATWQGGQVPGAGARVWILKGHTVVYDRHSEDVIRAIQISGTLTFATN